MDKDKQADIWMQISIDIRSFVSQLLSNTNNEMSIFKTAIATLNWDWHMEFILVADTHLHEWRILIQCSETSNHRYSNMKFEEKYLQTDFHVDSNLNSERRLWNHIYISFPVLHFYVLCPTGANCHAYLPYA